MRVSRSDLRKRVDVFSTQHAVEPFPHSPYAYARGWQKEVYCEPAKYAVERSAWFAFSVICDDLCHLKYTRIRH